MIAWWWLIPAVVGGMLLAYGFRCRHPWELLDKTILESSVEALLKAGLKGAETIPGSALIRTVILSFRCPRCGTLKIDKTVG